MEKGILGAIIVFIAIVIGLLVIDDWSKEAMDTSSTSTSIFDYRGRGEWPYPRDYRGNP